MKKILHKIPAVGLVLVCALGAAKNAPATEKMNTTNDTNDTVLVVDYKFPDSRSAGMTTFVGKDGAFVKTDNLVFMDSVKLPARGDLLVMKKVHSDVFLVIENLGQQKQK